MTESKRTALSHGAAEKVRGFVESTEWDGVKRMSRVFIEYLGAPDCEKTEETTREWFKSTIALGYTESEGTPNTLVLQGAQGIGKSSVVEALTGEVLTHEWIIDEERVDLKDVTVEAGVIVTTNRVTEGVPNVDVIECANTRYNHNIFHFVVSNEVKQIWAEALTEYKQ